jgi:hypothetical protein
VRIGVQVLLEQALIKLWIVERGQAGRQPHESPYEPELSDNYVDDVPKLGLSCELKSGFGLALHVGERISGCEKHRNQAVAGIDRIF